MSVSSLFKEFVEDLAIPIDTRSTISTRYSYICKRLNKDFWDMDTDDGGRYIGSYGRNTANGWVSDIDMLFEMPLSLYYSYSRYVGNGQSALLQQVKNSIQRTYPSTFLKGDGQIVAISFTDKTTFEVLPVFKNDDATYTHADSNAGGSWRLTNPIAEIDAIRTGDSLVNGNLKRLCKMARAWKFYCNVPIKGLLLDTLAYRFLLGWGYSSESYLYYDWMSRDFFRYLREQTKGQTIWHALGSNQTVQNAGDFRYKATVAFNKACEATKLGDEKLWSAAKKKWREIYGYRFPS